jgi:hypothetical protein
MLGQPALRFIIPTLLLASLASACLPSALTSRVNAPAPRPTPVQANARVFGLSSPGADGGLAAALTTSQRLERHVGIINFYEAWGSRPLPTATMQAISLRGAEPEITWEPLPQPGSATNEYSLEAIAAGHEDIYIEKWAKAARSYHKPFLLRFAHEMNLDSYPWSAQKVGTSTYLAAYRHVHDIFTQAGALNVAWVWSPGVIGGTSVSLASIYPGDSYVDEVGIDGYNAGAEIPSWGGWHSPSDLFVPTLIALRRLAPGKPVLLNELGSASLGGNKPQWITGLFDLLRSWPEVAGVIWFNFDPPGEPDWRLDNNAADLAAATKAIGAWQ